ncbi:MAG: GNAT family N-acetyltransferase [Bacteroidales bacterium]|nr:GNAT family N-acetyltransferase [Bacteroidales bacterium]
MKQKKIIKFNSDNKELLKKAFEIRTEVFVEEQNVDHEIEYDGYDDDAGHYIIFYNDVPIGTARRRFTEEGIKFERLAVLKTYRGLGLGGDLMQYMMDDVLPTDKKIYLNSQATVEKIYEKYGFKRVGEMFFEANIEHYKMVYEPRQ